MRAPNQRRSWIIPASITFILFVGGITANLSTSGMDDFVTSYRPWLWGFTLLAGLVAVAAAIWDQRQAQLDSIPVSMGETVKKYTNLRQRYLARIISDFQYVPLSAIDAKAASAETGTQDRLQMADVYIALNTTTRVAKSDEKRGRNQPTRGKKEQEDEVRLQSEGDDKPLSALGALVTSPRIVLLGDPGGGKSTFVNHLAFCLASDQLNPHASLLAKLEEWPAGWNGLLPVPVTLRELAAWYLASQPIERKIGLLHAYLAYDLGNRGLADLHQDVCNDLSRGSALLLLDGLDEVSMIDDVLQRVREMINALASEFPNTQMVATCRVLSYQDPNWQLDKQKWPVYELDKLNEAQVDHFIQAWHQQLFAMKVIKQAEVSSAKLSNAVRQPDLWRLARNPFLLTVMANVHTQDGELPTGRVALYERVVKLLLYRWDDKKHEGSEAAAPWRQLLQNAGVRDEMVQKALWPLAFQAQQQTQQLVAAERDASKARDATADISEASLIEALSVLPAEADLNWAKHLVEHMKRRTGLLVESRPKVYRFPHRTFQEYLAGCYLTDQPKFAEECAKLASQGTFWWETILLAVGRWAHHNQLIDMPLGLIDLLCPDPLPAHDDDPAWRNIWLAGKCLLEIDLQNARQREQGRKAIERVRSHLTHLITHDCLSVRERVEAAAVLSRIGDPRDIPDVAQEFEQNMLLIPAGGFLMGSSDSDRDAQDREKPRRKLFVDAFRISKYPVTNAQYARFVADTNHRAPGHWRSSAPPDELCNHPAVNVSWHDARAYCAWLSEKVGREIRLPSEAEWERAARGEKGITYPWGNDFNPDFCNASETGIGATCAVGIFAQGVSPYDLYDMAGNTTEWTLSLWGKDLEKPEFGYPYDRLDGRENVGVSDNVIRVVRGGSFASGANHVRCAYRHWNYPHDRYGSVGMRVVAPGS